MSKFFFYSFLFLVLFPLSRAFGQESPKSNPPVPLSSAEMGDASPFGAVTFSNGINFEGPNKRFGMVMRFRIQNRADFRWLENQDQTTGDKSTDFAHEWLVRRSRLRFNGYVWDPRWRYVLQLSFSKRDQDWEESQVPNVIRDAMILYDLTPNWTLAFGQGKLPGNRQRVISSGDLQFVDRSRFNAGFNIDRDFGFQTQYRKIFANQTFLFKGSITSGEGRNENTEASDRFFYTARSEWLPFGEFQRGGDYFESDLVFEDRLKLATGFTTAYLAQAPRTNGTIGPRLTVDGDPESNLVRRDQWVYLLDLIAKFRGTSILLELGQREAKSPLVNGNQALLVGTGGNLQIGRMMTKQDELAARHTWINPDRSVREILPTTREWTVVYNRFINGHRLKLQAEAGLIERQEVYTRLQIEFGI